LQANSFRGDALGMMESPEIPKILKLDDEEEALRRYGLATPASWRAHPRCDGRTLRCINHGAWDLHTNIYDKTQKSNQYTSP
jgi:hypothetical protein